MCNIVKFNKSIKLEKSKYYYICFGKGNFTGTTFKSFDEAYSSLCNPNCLSLNDIYKTVKVAIYESIGTFEDNNQTLHLVWVSNSSCM